MDRWVLSIIREGYPIKFEKESPSQVLQITPQSSTLREGVQKLFFKDAIEPLPPQDKSTGFYSLYFIVPKKDGELHAILELWT